MCDIKTFDSTLAKYEVKYNLSMALDKSSKKSQKPVSEPKTKAAVTGTKAKASQFSSVASTGNVGEAAPLKTRKKSSAVVNVASALQKDVVTTTDSISPKTMAAAVGSSAFDANSLSATATATAIAATSVPATLLESVPAETGTTVSAGHSAAPSNGTVHGASPEAIAQLAYFYWAERGYAHGNADEDWARAEAELNGHR